MVENNLINIDSDLFQSKENKTQLVEKLMNIWKTDPINNLKILLRPRVVKPRTNTEPKVKKTREAVSRVYYHVMDIVTI